MERLADNVWAVDPLAAPLWRAREPVGACRTTSPAGGSLPTEDGARSPEAQSDPRRSARPSGKTEGRSKTIGLVPIPTLDFSNLTTPGRLTEGVECRFHCWERPELDTRLRLNLIGRKVRPVPKPVVNQSDIPPVRVFDLNSVRPSGVFLDAEGKDNRHTPLSATQTPALARQPKDPMISATVHMHVYKL